MGQNWYDTIAFAPGNPQPFGNWRPRQGAANQGNRNQNQYSGVPSDDILWEGLDPPEYPYLTDSGLSDVTGDMLAAYREALANNQGTINTSADILGGLRGDLGSIFGPSALNLNNFLGETISGLNYNLDDLQRMVLEGSAGQRAQINQALPVNPYSDELRSNELARLTGEITGQSQADINTARSSAASRGLLNSSGALGSENLIRSNAMNARTAADRDTLAQQFGINQLANQGRINALNQLLGIETPALTDIGRMRSGVGQLQLGGIGLQGELEGKRAGLETALAGTEAGLRTSNLEDPNAVAAILGGAFNTQLGLNNQEQMNQFIQQWLTNEQNQAPWDILGSAVSGLAPGSNFAQVIAQLIGGFPELTGMYNT